MHIKITLLGTVRRLDSKIKRVYSKEFDITLSIPLKGKDKFFYEWGFFVGDIISTPLGRAIVTGRVYSGNKIGVIAKLNKDTESKTYSIVKNRFLILNNKELTKWKKRLSERGENIFIGTVNTVNLISIKKMEVGRTWKDCVTL